MYYKRKYSSIICTCSTMDGEVIQNYKSKYYNADDLRSMSHRGQEKYTLTAFGRE